MTRHSALLAVLLAVSAHATEVVIDAAQQRRAINPDIYGLIGGEPAQLSRMGITVRRHGGNGLSRYNWKTSTTNTGGDAFYFQKLAVPPADDFVSATKEAGARSMIELPMIGYVSQAMSGPLHCGFSVAKYGAQQSIDPNDADCGKGISPTGTAIAVDPLDTSIPADDSWSRAWVQHLVATFGTASNGGVRFYNLGNQAGLWHVTHRDIHPAPAGYSEIRTRFLAWARAVKEVDASALTLGPAAWGWLEYFDSAAGDRGTSGEEFIPWYLKQAASFQAERGYRLLDYLDVHVYPQGEGISRGDSTAPVNAMRLRSTRILWDPTYAVESWESCCNGGILKVLPRMHAWIDATYPHTKLAISGYGFGAIDQVNGALTQADVLGIFGREGVDLATLEVPPANGSIGEDAFKLFRNYDGQGAQFGTTSIKTSASTESLSTFAAFNAAGKVTVIAINKDPVTPNALSLRFSGVGTAGTWRAFQFGASGRLAPAGSGDMLDGTLARSVPAYTATLIEFTPTTGIGPPAPDAGVTPEVDAGTAVDAGTPATDGGTSTPTPPNKGCNATGGAGLALLALALLRRRSAGAVP